MSSAKPESPSETVFTPAIDRRIFEGYLGDRSLMIAELGAAGITEKEILKRGEVLGLSASFLAKCHTGGVDVAIRECLSCGDNFVSLGRQHRMCKKCRHKG